MVKKPLPTPELLRQLLRYEPDTGKVFWKERTPDMFKSGGHTAAHICARWNAKHAGKEAFTTVGSSGYRVANVYGWKNHAHRAIWAMAHGEWPADQIDHINGIRDDNRIGNLRAVTRAVNQKNLKRRSDNTSGVTGVSRRSNIDKWCAEIWSNGKKYHIGQFDSFDDAVSARKAAERLHGFHANHGRDG